MNCESARAGLWPPEQPRLLGDEIIEARRHVESCAECTAYFEQDRALLESYDRLRQGEAPREVREAVFDVLARERAGAARSRQTRRVLPLVAIAAIAAAALFVVPPTSGDAGSAPYIEDYLRRAVGQDHIVSSDEEEIARFLTRELGVPLAPLVAAGLQVARAEICLLEGRRGAMIVYEKDGREVSHYILPRERGAARAPMPGRGSGADAGPAVITWASPELEQALVSELDEKELLRMARLGSSM